MIETLALLVLALLVLYKSSDWVIKHAISLARFFKISDLAVGFLLVAVATSLPELMVGIFATARGDTGITIGNVLGANISDLCLVLGVSALLGTIVVKRKELADLTKILLAVSLLPIIIVANVFRGFEAVALLLIFGAFAYFILKRKVHTETRDNVTPKQAVLSAFLFSIGVALLLASSNFVVELAAKLALQAGLTQTLVGATIVSLGTTLPELTVSIAAMRRKNYSLALGNVLGSCITNLTLVLGVAAAINPLTTSFAPFLNLIAFMLAATILIWYFIQRNMRLGRAQGVLLVILYAIFLISAFRTELPFP